VRDVSVRTGPIFDWKTEVRDRLKRRGEMALPGARIQALLEGEKSSADAELVCAVRREGEPPLAGFVLVGADVFRSPEPLHATLGGRLGKMFGPRGIFHHVGGRNCLRRVPELREELWLREGVRRNVEVPFAGPGALAWCTVCGIGFLPVVGATLASLATALAAFGAGWVADWNAVRAGAAALCAVSSVASLLVERAAARHFLSDDAREFVLDEVAGMALALVFVPAHAWAWGALLAFGLFRFFDVTKPGIKWIERRNWRGKVVWDDLLAGLYAGVCTAGLLLVVR
jgi:phosphatidylglycerophosphatase A